MAKSNVIQFPIPADRDPLTIRNPISSNIKDLAILTGFINALNDNSEGEALADFKSLVGDKFTEDKAIKKSIKMGYQLYREQPFLKLDQLFY